MLTIRLQRVGRKHETSFRVVLTDSQNGPKSGKYLEILGAHDPRGASGNKSGNHLDTDRISHWMKHGAQVSDTVRNLLIDAKIISGKKIVGRPKAKPAEAKKEEVKTDGVAPESPVSPEETKAPQETPATEPEAPKS